MALAQKLMMVAPVGGGWDLANATFKPGAGTSYNTLGVVAQDTFAEESFFSSDGLNLYVVGRTGDSVYQYSLSTAWDLLSATYLRSFSVSAQETNPYGLHFSSDGFNMYVVGSTGDDVNQYTLSTAWNIGTASFLQTFSVAGEEAAPQSVFFSPDGTRMYVMGTVGRDVNQYALSTAWDISTASYVQLFSVATQETAPSGLFFSSDGLNMYVGGVSGRDVNQYALSTAWDISTASYVRVLSIGLGVVGVFFKPDGTKMFITSYETNSVRGYSLSTAWNISTASYDLPSKNYYFIGTEEISPGSVTLSSDGFNMYVVGSTGDDINQYTLSTAWDVTTASYLQRFSVSAQETLPSSHRWKTDGTAVYIMGTSGDDINQYSLSTAWDISTMSYVQSFSVAGQDTAPAGLFISPDGLNLYVTGDTGNDINQYALSTAWDISTASYVRVRSVSAETSTPGGIFFKPDGTVMFVGGENPGEVNQYNLSTAWNISTETYVLTFDTGQYDYLADECFFRADGKKMYTIGRFSDAVWSFDL